MKPLFQNQGSRSQERWRRREPNQSYNQSGLCLGPRQGARHRAVPYSPRYQNRGVKFLLEQEQGLSQTQSNSNLILSSSLNDPQLEKALVSVVRIAAKYIGSNKLPLALRLGQVGGRELRCFLKLNDTEFRIYSLWYHLQTSFCEITCRSSQAPYKGFHIKLSLEIAVYRSPDNPLCANAQNLEIYILKALKKNPQ